MDGPIGCSQELIDDESGKREVGLDRSDHAGEHRAVTEPDDLWGYVRDEGRAGQHRCDGTRSAGPTFEEKSRLCLTVQTKGLDINPHLLTIHHVELLIL